MAMLVKEFFHTYDKIREWNDPRVENLPLMGSPFSVATILIAYLYFIFKLGPSMMKNRNPYDLSTTLKAYNVGQVVINLIGFGCGVYFIPKSSLYCMPVMRTRDFDALYQLGCHYLFFLLKVADLFDTITFVLRKKYRQITFLHMYHHVSMVIGAWITCNYFPGGQLYFVGTINCFVHAVMYLYYLLTIVDPSYKSQIWWKKHLTQLQITQHCLIFLSILIPLLNPTCSYPKLMLGGYLPFVGLMIFLFGDFYYKAYVKQKKL